MQKYKIIYSTDLLNSEVAKCACWLQHGYTKGCHGHSVGRHQDIKKNAYVTLVQSVVSDLSFVCMYARQSKRVGGRWLNMIHRIGCRKREEDSETRGWREGNEIEVEEPGRCWRRRIINLEWSMEGVNWPEGVGGGEGRRAQWMVSREENNWDEFKLHTKMALMLCWYPWSYIFCKKNRQIQLIFSKSKTCRHGCVCPSFWISLPVAYRRNIVQRNVLSVRD